VSPSRRGREAALFRPYRELLALPGAVSFSIAGFLARMPLSMLGIGTVLMVSATSGSYALAGAVAACLVLVQSLAAPQLARLVDRLGQARVLRPAVVVHAAGLCGLVGLAVGQAPAWTLFVAASVAGASMVGVSSLVRARWAAQLSGPGRLGSTARLQTAYAWESVAEETIFVVGPVLVTVLATRVAPAAGLLTVATLAVTGSFALARLRDTEPPASGVSHRGGTAALRSGGMAVLFATFTALGGVFGSTEVIAVAFTAERGEAGAAGLVLAAFAGSSMLAGLAYGAVHWRRPAGFRFLVSVLFVAVAVVPFALVTSVPALAVATAVAGMGISPTIVAGFGMAETLVPAARLTEGLTWLTTGLGFGAAAGAWAAGAAIDAYGGHHAFWVAVGSGVLAGVVALAGSRELRSAPGRPARLPRKREEDLDAAPA